MMGTNRAKIGAAALLLATAGAAAAWAAGEAVHIDRQKWSFGGVFGHFDDNQLQRGFKVYTEVCARCHSIKRLHFRNLAQPGGPGFPEAAKSPWPPTIRSRTRRTRPARSASARRSSPMPSPAPSRTSRRPASPRTAPSRPTFL